MKLRHGPMTRPANRPFYEHPAWPMIVIGAALAALALLTIYNL